MSDDNTYELISAPYPAELSDAVSERIAEGWKVLGGPFTDGESFYQAVVRAPEKRLRRGSAEGESA